MPKARVTRVEVSDRLSDLRVRIEFVKAHLQYETPDEASGAALVLGDCLNALDEILEINDGETEGGS